jgi:hypothetical protein
VFAELPKTIRIDAASEMYLSLLKKQLYFSFCPLNLLQSLAECLQLQVGVGLSLWLGGWVAGWLSRIYFYNTISFIFPKDRPLFICNCIAQIVFVSVFSLIKIISPFHCVENCPIFYLSVYCSLGFFYSLFMIMIMMIMIMI